MTYQKLYKIYLRDARLEEAEEVFNKMRPMMVANGNAPLPVHPNVSVNLHVF